MRYFDILEKMELMSYQLKERFYLGLLFLPGRAPVTLEFPCRYVEMISTYWSLITSIDLGKKEVDIQIGSTIHSSFPNRLNFLKWHIAYNI